MMHHFRRPSTMKRDSEGLQYLWASQPLPGWKGVRNMKP